ncbi:MAG: fibrobacter succinogenes major paralogous domain-containing protein [Bacteroidales bacterium]|nr:fibrobacter succinogenes major paralogous domain-containing protein [Bacteroidales bacterium]MDY0216108.1 fibrobacter succinogenes major paralogous domain-containing protein [Bacteroidales bacterium]
MKKSIILTAIMVLFAFCVNAQNDTMYIMKAGVVVGQYNVNTELDSVIFYQPTIEEPTSGSFTDVRDGNVYQTVTIGSQEWMAENLKYLPSAVGLGTGSQTTPYYYVYGYDGTSVSAAKATAKYGTYGVLYNWPAAMAGSASSSANPSDVQGVCPSGWHLPSDAEWTQLTDYLGGQVVAGGKLKEAGTTHWYSPNTGATNETGFTALPGGYRGSNGTFDHIGIYGSWWSATEFNTDYAWFRSMFYFTSDVYRNYNYKEMGFSVRCLRD